MSKTLATFMVIAATAVTIITLVIGVAYQSLQETNEHHEEMLQTEHQLKIK